VSNVNANNSHLLDLKNPTSGLSEHGIDFDGFDINAAVKGAALKTNLLKPLRFLKKIGNELLELDRTQRLKRLLELIESHLLPVAVRVPPNDNKMSDGHRERARPEVKII